MRQSHHDADAVCGREDFERLADADETGVVGVVVLDVAFQYAEAVEVCAAAGGDAGDIVALGVRHRLGGDCGVGARRDLGGGADAGEEGGALKQKTCISRRLRDRVNLGEALKSAV